MKHHCKYCGEKLMEGEDKDTGTCDSCNCEFATKEDEFDSEYDWYQCSACGEWLEILADDEHECSYNGGYWEYGDED